MAPTVLLCMGLAFLMTLATLDLTVTRACRSLERAACPALVSRLAE